MAAPTDAELLAAVRTAILNLVERGQQSVVVAGQTYTYLDLDKLRALEARYQRRVDASTRAAASESRVSVGAFQRPG